MAEKHKRSLFSKTRKLSADLREALLDDSKRVVLQYMCVYVILAAVSLFMTVVNIFTHKYLLMISTAAFTLVNVLNIVMTKIWRKGMVVAAHLFITEVIALFVFFIISGTPEGFSAIWVCLVPSSGLLLFGKKRGTVICMLVFVITTLLLHTPFGVSLLQYNYTDSFRLRFPLLYLAFFAVSYFLETVRELTNERLQELQHEYKELYCHDALTGLYNRYGFNNMLTSMLDESKTTDVSLLIVDIDYFKTVNDTFGHKVGDSALIELAKLLTTLLKDRALVCRWGGEEFAVLFEHSTGVQELAQEILTAVSQKPLIAAGNEVSLTVSIGVATVKVGEQETASELLSRADKNLYRAKDNGRNCAQFD